MSSTAEQKLTRDGRRASQWGIVGIMLLATVLRLYRLGWNSLWFDEVFSWLVARHPIGAILTQGLEFFPPLYSSLLHFWIKVSEREIGLRSLSALCGLLVVPIMYALGRALFTSATGLAAALLAAVLPFQIYYSQEARPYALVILLSALMFWVFVRAWKGAGYRLWIVLGVLVALNFYAHYFTIFTWAVFNVYVLLMRSCNWRGWRGVFLADLIALALVGPHLPSAWAQTRQVVGNFWLSSPSPLELFKTLVYLLFSHTTPLLLVPVVLFLTLSILIFVTWAALRASSEIRQWLVLLLALTFIPMFLVLVLSWLIHPLYLDRAFGLVTPAYVLLLGWGLTHPLKSSPLPLLYGGLAMAAVASLGNYYLNACRRGVV